MITHVCYTCPRLYTIFTIAGAGVATPAEHHYRYIAYGRGQARKNVDATEAHSRPLSGCGGMGPHLQKPRKAREGTPQPTASLNGVVLMLATHGGWWPPPTTSPSSRRQVGQTQRKQEAGGGLVRARVRVRQAETIARVSYHRTPRARASSVKELDGMEPAPDQRLSVHQIWRIRVSQRDPADPCIVPDPADPPPFLCQRLPCLAPCVR